MTGNGTPSNRCGIEGQQGLQRVSGRYTYPTHTGDGRYTYRAGGGASSCVAALTREWPLTSRFTIIAVACRLIKRAYTDRKSTTERLLTNNRILFSHHENYRMHAHSPRESMYIVRPQYE